MTQTHEQPIARTSDHALRAGGPIFICGASRSGTSMLQAMLNRHPMMEIQGETHYFDDLRQKMAGYERASLDDVARKTCEDYFLALEHRPYGHAGDPEKSPLARPPLRDRADAIGQGADPYFEAPCRLRPESAHAQRWGAKTPRPIFRLP